MGTGRNSFLKRAGRISYPAIDPFLLIHGNVIITKEDVKTEIDQMAKKMENLPIPWEALKKVSNRDRRIAWLNQMVMERDKEIVRMLHSFSWRLTRPLRIIRKWCRFILDL